MIFWQKKSTAASLLGAAFKWILQLGHIYKWTCCQHKIHMNVAADFKAFVNTLVANIFFISLMSQFRLPHLPDIWMTSHGLYRDTSSQVDSLQESQEWSFGCVLTGQCHQSLQWRVSSRDRAVNGQTFPWNHAVTTRRTNLYFEGVRGVGAQLADVHSGFL